MENTRSVYGMKEEVVLGKFSTESGLGIGSMSSLVCATFKLH